MRNPGACTVSCFAAVQLISDLDEVYRGGDTVDVRYYNASLKSQDSTAGHFFHATWRSKRKAFPVF